MRATEYGLLHNGNYSYKDVKSNIYAFNNEISVANDETDEEEENAYTEIVYVEIEPYGEANPNEYKIVTDGEILDIREGNYLLNSNATSATEIAEPATIHFQNSSTTAQICKFDNTYFALITKSEIGAIEWNFLLEDVEIQASSPLKKKKREKITLLNDILKEKQLSVILFISKDGAMLETAYQSIDNLYENEIILFIETNDKKNLFGSVVRIKTGVNVTSASGVPCKKLSKVVDYFNTHIHSVSLLEIIQEHVEDKSSNFFIVKSAAWGIINKVVGFTSKLTLEGIEILSDGIAGLIGKLKLDDSQWQYYDEKGQPLKNPNLFLPGLGGIQYLEAMNKKGKPLDPEKTNTLAINKIVYLENVLRNQKRDLGEAKFFKDIINQQLYVLARVKDFLSNPLDKVLELAEITFVMYNAFIVGLINSIIDAIKGIFDIITLICKGLIVMREKGQNVAENPLSYISLFFEMIENMLETLANLFSKENLKALIEFFKKSGLFILTLPSKIFNWLAEGVQMPNLDKVAYYIGYIIGFIIQLVLEILFTGGAKTVADAFKKLADSLISIFKTMKSFVFKFKEGAVIAFENFLAIFAYIREKSKNLKVLLDEVWEFIQTLFRNKKIDRLIKGRLHKGGDFTKSFFENAGILITKISIKGKVFGQTKDYTCVANSLRMALDDKAIIKSEEYLAGALETTVDGARILDIPKALHNSYLDDVVVQAEKKITLESLLSKLADGDKAVVSVFTDDMGHHAVLLDEVKNGRVIIRDPLPKNVGSSYSVSIDDFRDLFREKAVIIKK